MKKSNFLRLFFLGIFGCFFFSSAYSKDRISVASYHIPGLVEEFSATPGSFLKSFKAVFRSLEKELGIVIDMNFFPPIRARKRFKEGKAFGLLIGFKSVVPESEYLASALPIAKKIEFLFYHVDTNPEKTLNKGKYTMVSVRGFYHGPKTLEKFKGRLKVVDSAKSAIKMLQKKRVDFILGDATTLKPIVEKQIEDITFDPKNPTASTPAYFYTQDTPLGRKFMQRFNQLSQEKNIYKNSQEYMQDLISKFQEMKRPKPRP